MHGPALALVGALLALGAAQPAFAADFPVTTSAELQSAITAAQTTAERDRILLAAGTYDGPFAYNDPDPVEIVGAGVGQTILTRSAGSYVIQLRGGAHRIADLTIATGAGATIVGLVLGGSSIGEDIAVADTGATNTTGVQVDGTALLRDATVLDHDARGVSVVSGTPAIENVTITGAGSYGVDSGTTGASITVRGSRISGYDHGVRAGFSGIAHVSDTLIRLTGGSSVGLSADDSNNPATHTAQLDAQRVTIVGDGSAGAVGAQAYALSAGDQLGVVLRDSIITGVGHPFTCHSANGGVATAEAYHSNYVLAGINGACAATVVHDHRTQYTPQFVDAAAGDFRLAPGSPLIDAADPLGPVPPGTRDAGAVARPNDGDGDCARRADVGAFEFHRTVPVAAATASAPAAATGESVTFSAAGSCDPEPDDTITYAWSFSDGATATGVSVGHAFAVPGAHTATLTVTDGAAQTAQAAASVTVTAPVDPGGSVPGNTGTGDGSGPATTSTTEDPAPGGTLAPVADRVAPKVLSLRAPARLTRGRALPRLLAPAARGAALRFALSEAATVELTLRRGRTVRTLRLTAPAGASRLRFAGRLNRRAALRRGRWSLTLVAIDAAGNRSAPARATVRLL